MKDSCGSVEIESVGATRDTEEFRTNSRRLAQFAMALSDTNTAHLAGDIASPVFAHVPVMQSMVEVIEAHCRGFVFHGEHDFHYHLPIVPAQRLFSRSKLIGTGNTRAGALLFVESDTRTDKGVLISTQYSTCLLQGTRVDDTGERPAEKPHPEAGDTILEEAFPIPEDQTRRYAEAARDYSPYTLDSDAAKAVGHPAPFVHGMCSLGIASRPLVDRLCGGEVRRLKRLGCRFSHPLYLTPRQELRVRFWAGPSLYGFEARDREGNVVIKNGFAEVTP